MIKNFNHNKIDTNLIRTEFLIHITTLRQIQKQVEMISYLKIKDKTKNNYKKLMFIIILVIFPKFKIVKA